MPTLATPTPEKTAHPAIPGFRHVRSSLSYADMNDLRYELSEFFQLRGVPHEHIGNLQLCLTEILSNIVKHPPKKADYIEIRADMTDAKTELEVIDNSTPFANFDAKCEKALSVMSVAARGEESGYGLGCILTLCKKPQYIPMNASPDRLNHFKITQDAVLSQPAAKARKKLFLVDDDPISIQIHRAMLDNVYDVLAFEKAEDALAVFLQEKPDLVISDLTMPGMDGIALRRALSETENGNTTPFIFLSGYTENENNPYISHLGVDDFLCKPVTREKLHAVLARLLRRSQQIQTSLHGQFSRDISELLKPSLQETYGAWKFHTRCQIVEAGGGDFILHHQTPTNLMVVLADVMGHGRQAKFFSYAYAGYLRSMFRMYAGTLDTAHFLRYLSQSIMGDELLESIVMTCQCFQFFPEGILKISSAGHPRPVILRQNGMPELLEVMGPLPGLT
jgi:DNA-binding response OmpR family regulator/anti-sigma regulatory factor (Ser/Thr protein kinase)